VAEKTADNSTHKGSIHDKSQIYDIRQN